MYRAGNPHTAHSLLPGYLESGTWAGDNAPEPIRPGGVFIAGQDQDSLRGEYNPRQSWSGSLTQMNLWDFSIEKWDIENIAECRSDVFGNVVKVKILQCLRQLA